MKVSEEVREIFRKFGKQSSGPSKGGKARAEKLSAEELTESARKAGIASGKARKKAAAKKKTKSIDKERDG